MTTKFIFFFTLTILILSGTISKAQVNLLDTSFVIGTGFNDDVRTIITQVDGKILVGGKFTNYNGVQQNYISRLNTDGSLDTSFNIGTGFSYIISTIVLQSDGKILVGGTFTSYNGINRNAVVRLNTDGSLDTSFINEVTGLLNTINSIAIQSDGKILIGGNFQMRNGTSQKRIARLNIDGSWDTTFVGDFSQGSISSIAIQPDGKILAGGDLIRYINLATTSSLPVSSLVRLNTDGSIDPSFEIKDGFSGTIGVSFETVVIQPDGKILVGGEFYTKLYNGAIARLNPDGSLDIPFMMKTSGPSVFYGSGGYHPIIKSIALQPDGKILVGGRYLKNSPILRLNPDGGIQSYIQTGPPGNPFNDIFPDYYMNKIALQSDGKILVGGKFNSYNLQPRNNILRLINTTLSVEDSKNKNIRMYPNPAKNAINFSKEISYAEIYSLDGRKVMSNIKGNSADISKLERETYIIKGIDKEGQSFSQKLIKQ